jgi:mono/diheme cytochrome c family protein
MNKQSTALLGIAGVAALAAGFALNVSAQEPRDPALQAEIDLLVAEGDIVYHSVGCSGCHGANGEGANGPPFVGNTTLESAGAIIAQMLFPDQEHDPMPAFGHLEDRQLAAVATYIRNSWGNNYGIARETSVAFQRNAVAGGD